MPRIPASRPLLHSSTGSRRRSNRGIRPFAALSIAALAAALCSVRPEQTSGAVRPQPIADTAARVERVLKGLRPKIEAEGAPVRWALAERMAAWQVPAVSIAIVDSGRVVWAQGFGLKEVGGKEPVTAMTLFQAASCSKPIVASAVLRLVDKGTLSLDTDVNRYLTSWKLPENELTRQEKVTLRRLVTHTGGTTVSHFPGYKVGEPRPTVPELLDGKAPANNKPVVVDTVPGKSYRYSGGGFTIIQQALTDVTGTSFPALVQQQVFGPLGMSHSTFEQPLPAARAADAARAHENNTVVPGGWHVYPELAAAGLWTTPTDLATWAIAMADAVTGQSTRFLSKATASQVIDSAVSGRSARERIGLGLSFYVTGDMRSFVHNGQNEGFMNEVKMFANRGQGATIMINAGESSFGLIREIGFAIAEEFGWPESEAKKITVVAVDPAALDRLTGTYVFEKRPAQPSPRVVREGTRLFFHGWAAARYELYPQSPTTFIAAEGTRFSFTRDAAGRDVVMMGEGPKAHNGIKQ